jgi:hypothetical protein
MCVIPQQQKKLFDSHIGMKSNTASPIRTAGVYHGFPVFARGNMLPWLLHQNQEPN